MRTGFIDPEKIIIIATTNPPRAPSSISGDDVGIEKAVARAVVVVIRRRIPVFSDTPSILIMLDSYPSHHWLSLYADFSKVESLSAGFPDLYIESRLERHFSMVGLKSVRSSQSDAVPYSCQAP